MISPRCKISHLQTNASLYCITQAERRLHSHGLQPAAMPYPCTFQPMRQDIQGPKVEGYCFDAGPCSHVVDQGVPEATNGPSKASYRISTAHVKVHDEGISLHAQDCPFERKFERAASGRVHLSRPLPEQALHMQLNLCCQMNSVLNMQWWWRSGRTQG